jgi:hypothetical protein
LLAITDNPEFLADLTSGLSGSAIAQKWGISKTSANKYRQTIQSGEVLVDKRLLPGEGESTDADGTRNSVTLHSRQLNMNDARDWLRSTGDNPDDFSISIRSIAYGEGLWSNKMAATPKRSNGIPTVPLAELYRTLAEHKAPPRPAKVVDDLATVVVLADWQIGKTGRRGGTPELLQRLAAMRGELEAELSERQPGTIVILDAGDGIENFESGGNPMFTNDLSLPDQLDCYSTELFKFLEVADRHSSDIKVGVVPSNHSAWRNGKQNLGRPSDDFGIHTHKQVAKVAGAAGMNVQFHYPAEYDESLMIDVFGTGVGLVHGNQFGQGQAINWWQAQAFGSQAITKADIMASGHYHTFGAGTAGINPFSERERMWLGAPTADNGSDWYRTKSGRDSLPGTLIFDVSPDGFSLSSLTII